MPVPFHTPLTRFVQQQWQHGGWLSTLLRPLSALTARHVQRKRQDYLTGRRQAWRAGVPVIVIGNLYVGGTGKTPVTIAVVRALQAGGWQPGVVSRGYGVAVGATPRCGMAPLNATHYGDEPALIAANTGAPVAVHPRRPLAAAALLAKWPQTDILVCDDGLQHLALHRDLEIIVQDERGIGNGRLLPAGPLREPATRLHSVAAIITNRNVFPTRDTHQEAKIGAVPQVDMVLAPMAYEHLLSGRRLTPDAFAADSVGLQLAAAAGIGHPTRYFAMLRQHGLTLTQTLALPDHHDYARSPFSDLTVDRILITAKDATKCRALDDPRLWIVHAEASFRPEDWLAPLLARLGSAPRCAKKDKIAP